MSPTDSFPLAHHPSSCSDAWIAIVTILLLATLAAGYGRGVHEIWARLGPGAVVSWPSVGSFAIALVLLYLADREPLHTVAERSLTGHMTQHMILLLAGGLLAAGRSGLPLILATPHRARRWLGRWRVGRAGAWLRRPLHIAVVAATVHTSASTPRSSSPPGCCGPLWSKPAGRAATLAWCSSCSSRRAWPARRSPPS
jgi:putative membrane protein